MPHIHLETTPWLLTPERATLVLKQLAARLATFETIESQAIKAYHSERTTYVTGEGAPRGFVHCTVAIQSGRPLELRKQIADGMYELLVEQLGRNRDLHQASITLEVREMDRETYRR